MAQDPGWTVLLRLALCSRALKELGLTASYLCPDHMADTADNQSRTGVH